MNVKIMSNEEDKKNGWKTYFHDLLNVTAVEHNTYLDTAHTNETRTEPEIVNEPPYVLRHRSSNTINEKIMNH